VQFLTFKHGFESFHVKEPTKYNIKKCHYIQDTNNGHALDYEWVTVLSEFQ